MSDFFRVRVHIQDFSYFCNLLRERLLNSLKSERSFILKKSCTVIMQSSVVWLFLTIPRVCLQFVIVVFPDRTHLLFSLLSFQNPHSS